MLSRVWFGLQIMTILAFYKNYICMPTSTFIIQICISFIELQNDCNLSFLMQTLETLI